MKLSLGLFISVTLCSLLAGCGASGTTDTGHISSDIGRVASLEQSTVDISDASTAEDAVLGKIVVHGTRIGKRLGFDPITLVLTDPSSPRRITAGVCNPNDNSGNDVACFLFNDTLEEYRAHLNRPYTVLITQGGVTAKGERPTLTFYDSRIDKP